MNTVIVSIVSPEYEYIWEVCRASLDKYLPAIKYIKVSTEEQWIQDLKKDYPYEDIGQFICAIRPTVVLKYLQQYDKVLFLGSDVVFFNTPNILLNPDYNVIVFPHIVNPIPFDCGFPSMENIPKTGNINSDIVLWSNNQQVLDFLEWQQEAHKKWCIIKDGIFLDQTWLNQLPFFVDDVFICRHPGYNVAYFNLKERLIWSYVYSFNLGTGENLDNSEGYEVSDLSGNHYPLFCVQFSGFIHGYPEKISKYASNLEYDRINQTIFNWYDEQLTLAKQKQFKKDVSLLLKEEKK